jgi:hypothetical protein
MPGKDKHYPADYAPAFLKVYHYKKEFKRAEFWCDTKIILLLVHQTRSTVSWIAFLSAFHGIAGARP